MRRVRRAAQLNHAHLKPGAVSADIWSGEKSAPADCLLAWMVGIRSMSDASYPGTDSTVGAAWFPPDPVGCFAMQGAVTAHCTAVAGPHRLTRDLSLP